MILIGALLFSTCSYYEKRKTDLTEQNLNGKVKSYTEFSYKERLGIEKGKRERKFTLKYDEDGNTIEWNGYKSDGSSLDIKYTHKYDEDGNKIESNSYKSDGSLSIKYIFKHDEDGNLIEMNIYKSDGSLDSRYTSKYDEDGNKIESNNYESDGSLYSKETYKYDFDNKGNWIKKVLFENEVPKYISEREYEYYE